VSLGVIRSADSGSDLNKGWDIYIYVFLSLYVLEFSACTRMTISPTQSEDATTMVDDAEFDEYDDDGFDEAFADLLNGLKEAETRNTFHEPWTNVQ
jgi:hypothetical protein